VRRWAVLVSALVAGACWNGDGASGDRAALIQRDSSGIQVVEAGRGVMASLPVWTLAEESRWGGVDAAAAQQFFRVVDVSLLEDGTVAVVNRGTSEVRFFDRNGVLRTGIGSKGNGPREFGAPIGIARIRGDSLVVVDGDLARLSILAPDHGISRTVRLQGALPSIAFAGVIDGDLVAIEDRRIRTPQSTSPETSLAKVVLFDLEGNRVATVGEFPERRWVRFGAQQIYSPTFDPTTSVVAGRSGIWIGTGRSYQVEFVGTDGRPSTITRWSGPDRRVTPADRRRWISELLKPGRPEAERQAVQTWAREMVFADDMAAYARLLPTSEGGVWVECYHPFEADVLRWLVLDAAGRPTAVVEGRGHQRIVEVDGDEATAVTADESGVAQVVLYRVERSSRMIGGSLKACR
jgi:hypothetical protein